MRRVLAALIVLLVLLVAALVAEAPRFVTVARISATDQERDELMVAFGNDIMIVVRDKALFEQQIAPLIGRDMKLTLTEPE